MISVFRGATISDVYPRMMSEVLIHGVDKTPRGKPTKDLHPVVLHLTNSTGNKFIYVVGRQFNYAFAIAEIFWILSGRGDYEFIGYYNQNIRQFLDFPEFTIQQADMVGMNTSTPFHGAYGPRLRRRGVDQLSCIIQRLKADTDSRQAVANIWDGNLDNIPTSKDYPCNVLLMFKITNGRLDLSVVRRSNDIVWGLPYNIVQFTSIQEYVASHVGVPCGDYYEFIDSLHIYTKEYPELYKLFEDRVVGPIDFGMSNCIGAVPIVPMGEFTTTPLCDGLMLDTFLKKFMSLERNCRIELDHYGKCSNFIFQGWMGELNAISPNQYWHNLSKFLLLYHAYKNKSYDLVLSQLQSMPARFQFMGLETFRNISWAIKKLVLIHSPWSEVDAKLISTHYHGGQK